MKALWEYTVYSCVCRVARPLRRHAGSPARGVQSVLDPGLGAYNRMKGRITGLVPVLLQKNRKLILR